MSNPYGLPPGLIRRAQFRHLVPFATNTIQRMIKRGDFPPPDPRVSSARLYLWRSEVIAAWYLASKEANHG
jgi:predicted DNA-binding transcriptional regulator AlpA